VILNDFDAERALLGSLLVSGDTFDAVMDIVFPECWVDPAHRSVADAVWSLAKAKKPIEPVGVTAALREAGAEVPESIAYQLQAEGSTVDTVTRAHAERIRQLWAIRQRRQVALDILNAPIPKSIEEAIASDATRLLGIETGRNREARQAKTILLERFEELEREWKAGPEDRKRKLIDTGLRELDVVLQGMVPGIPVMVAARPSAGKTAIAIAVSEYVASTDTPVYIQWLEDFADSWANRSIAYRAQIPTALLRHGSSLRKEHWDSIMLSMNATADHPLWIDDEHALTARQIVQRIKRFRRNLPAKYRDRPMLAICDHLGEMRLDKSESWGDSRHDLALGAAIRIFRDGCKEANAVPMLMAQLNREPEKREKGAPPKLSDIFGTGEAEQIVRTAIFLSRNEDTIYAYVAKNTNGPKDVEVKLDFHGPTMTVRSKGPPPPIRLPAYRPGED
jgi:replicative DNA helicase